MTSHFIDKIEKASSLHQTCNLHQCPFSPSLLCSKWKKCPSVYQRLVPSGTPWISWCQILSSFSCTSCYNVSPSLSHWISTTTKDNMLYYLSFLLKEKQNRVSTVPYFPMFLFLEFIAQVLTYILLCTVSSDSLLSIWFLPPYSPNDFPGNVQAKGSKGLQDAK